MVAMALMRSSKRSVPIAASDAAAEAKKMFAGDPLMDICDRPAVIITIARNEYESDADLCARVAGALPAELASEVRLLSRSEDQQ
jgi:hypothetical protein